MLGILALLGLLLNSLGPLLPMRHMPSDPLAGITVHMDASKAAAIAFVAALDPHALCTSIDESEHKNPATPLDKSHCPICLTLRMVGPLAFVAVAQLNVALGVAGHVEQPALPVPAPLAAPRSGEARAPPHLS
ncbi:MAG: hypothetical protein PW790_11470 [Parvibaculaceae bacterium]|nr:hypothetical protein [Parvibaculaceae bacterium]